MFALEGRLHLEVRQNSVPAWPLDMRGLPRALPIGRAVGYFGLGSSPSSRTRCKDQKSIALLSLMKIRPLKVGFGELRETIAAAQGRATDRG